MTSTRAFDDAVRALRMRPKSRAVRGARLMLLNDRYLDEAAAAVGIHKSGVSRVHAAIKRHLLAAATRHTDQADTTAQPGHAKT